MIRRPLDRFSKRRGPGDQTSGGRGKLLRPTTDLTRIELLVRETLQNSWDARSDSWFPAYGLRIHRATDAMRAVLCDEVFLDLPQSLDALRASLTNPDLHIVEIFDRGTVGLNGPVRAGEVAAPGEASNFSSFVFDIGTTKTSKGAGGTYGFGKTAAFEVSRAHTVVYWSRTRSRGSEGELEHRLIASSLHEPYEQGGARYTGAHWWGRTHDDDVEPLRGADAKRVGEALFRTHFGDEETGTSILIIDPVITIDSDDADSAGDRLPVQTETHVEVLVSRATRALVRSAWPKAIPEECESTPMIIELFNEDEERDVTSLMAKRAQDFAYPLSRIRVEQGTQLDPTLVAAPADLFKEKLYPIRLRPSRSSTHSREHYFGDRSDNIAGHLYVTMRPGSKYSDQDLPRNSVCLMRSNAELVVAYESGLDIDLGAVEWNGVFKPTPECDHHFASSEPPSHDAWSPNSAETEVGTYVVEKAMQQVRRKIRDFTASDQRVVASGEQSVRNVATALRSFVPLGPAPDQIFDGPGAPTRRRSEKRGRVSGPSAEILDARPLADGSGQRLQVRIAGAPLRPAQVHAKILAITSDGRMEMEEGEASVKWFDSRTGFIGLERTIIVKTPAELELEIATLNAVAFEVVVSVEVES